MSNVISRVWLGGAMPDRFKEYGAEWEALNPNWKVYDWTEEEVWDTEWDNQSILNIMREENKQPNADHVAFYTHVADVIGYEIAYYGGGFYVNTDVKPLKPLMDFDMSIPGFAMEDDIHPVNMAMYTPSCGKPGSDLFANIIEILPMRYHMHRKQGMHISTGVGLIAQALDEYSGPVQFWHRNVFNPIHWSEIAPGTVPDIDRDYPPETIATHTWSHKEFQRGAEILP